MDFSSSRATLTLQQRSMRPNRRSLKPSSLQLCRKFIKLQAEHQAECPEVCQVVCQVEVCPIWVAWVVQEALEALQTLA